MPDSLVIRNCSLQQESELGVRHCNEVDPNYNGTSKIKLALKSRLSLWPERFVLALICTVVAIGFFTPVIIYFTGSPGSFSQIDFNFDNCSSVIIQDDNISALSLYDDDCSSYSGICLEYLEEQDNNFSFSLALKEASDDDIAILIDILNRFMGTSIVSEECAEVVLPFLCQYLHPPCDGNGSVNLISQEQCSNIRDVVCAGEWRLVMATSSSSLLPVCEHFSDVGNITDDNAIPQPLQCHYQFKEYCGLCRPLCGEFSQHSVKQKFQERIIIILTCIMILIGGILVFIAAIIRRDFMMKFPAILVVYWTLCPFIIACLVLIAYLGGQERLYCTDEYVDRALENPSVFCQISGFFYHWLLVLLSIFWFQHLCHLFIKIMFPIWSRKLDDKKVIVILHVTEVSGAVLISILPPVVYLAVSDYIVARFPPVICVPSRIVTFYTVCLPLCVIVGSGSILLIIMLWTLVKRKQLFKKESSRNYCMIKFGVPEVKILLLSIYFVVFGIVTLVTLSVGIRDSDIIADRFLKYILCQASGYTNIDSCATERDELESRLQPGLSSATYILLGLLPWSNLLFAIQFTDAKKALQKMKSVYQHFTQDKSTSTTNTQ